MPKTGRPHGRPSAEEAMAPTWRALVSDLRRAEADVRLDRSDAVHEFRVAARRLRSIIVGLRPLLDPGECDALERQMRSTARAVSGARDAEVIKRRIERLLGEQSRDGDLVETSDRLDRLIAGSYEQSLRYAVEHLESDVYDSFTRRLERFADLPPWLPQARASAEVTLKPLLGHQWSRLRARSRKALSTEPGTVRDERLHVARKAAKRARYLAEAVTPVLGRRAEKMGKVAGHAQRVLGHYQDGVITYALLADAGEQAFRQGENSFVLGRMQAREAAAMAELYADFAHVAEAIERKSHRRWLR